MCKILAADKPNEMPKFPNEYVPATYKRCVYSAKSTKQKQNNVNDDLTKKGLMLIADDLVYLRKLKEFVFGEFAEVRGKIKMLYALGLIDLDERNYLNSQLTQQQVERQERGEQNGK